MTTQQQPFFVRINAPDLLRVSLLESSKLVLHSLQSYYKITTIRKKKQASLHSLKSEVKELVLLLGKLESMLPYQDIVINKFTPTQAKNSQITKAARSHMNASKEVVDIVNEPSFSELDKLNRALASIDEKLNQID